MKELIIKRSQWLHGEGSCNSFLLRSSDNKMCCLGFYSLNLGYSKEDILNVQSPLDVADKNKYPISLFNDNSYSRVSLIIKNLMNINDAFKSKIYFDGFQKEIIIEQEEREMLISKEFLKLNVKVIFED